MLQWDVVRGGEEGRRRVVEGEVVVAAVVVAMLALGREGGSPKTLRGLSKVKPGTLNKYTGAAPPPAFSRVLLLPRLARL